MLRSHAVAMSCINTDRIPGSRGARGQVVSSPACTVAISGTFACVLPSSDALEGVTLCVTHLSVTLWRGLRASSVRLGLACLARFISVLVHFPLSPPPLCLGFMFVPLQCPGNALQLCAAEACVFSCARVRVRARVCVQHCLPRHSG